MSNQCLDTMKVQQEQIGQHKATIDQLFQAQLADPDDIQTLAYVVGEKVLRKLGQGSAVALWWREACCGSLVERGLLWLSGGEMVILAGSYSWARIKPLPRQERNFILRTHAGTFVGFPPDLDLVTATKALKEVQAAKLSLSTFATQKVTKHMARNAHTVKMTGTVYSRIIEMREELESRRAEDDSFKEGLLVPMDDILEFLYTLEESASGAMDIAIDNQTLMRTAVSKRLEEAIGVAHLRPETDRKAREDFLSSETLSLIKAAATRSEDLSWTNALHTPTALIKPLGAEKIHGVRAPSPAVRTRGKRVRRTPRAIARRHLSPYPRAMRTLPRDSVLVVGTCGAVDPKRGGW